MDQKANNEVRKEIKSEKVELPPTLFTYLKFGKLKKKKKKIKIKKMKIY